MFTLLLISALTMPNGDINYQAKTIKSTTHQECVRYFKEDAKKLSAKSNDLGWCMPNDIAKETIQLYRSYGWTSTADNRRHYEMMIK